MQIRNAYMMSYYVGEMEFVEVCGSVKEAADRAEMWKGQGFMARIYPIGALCK